MASRETVEAASHVETVRDQDSTLGRALTTATGSQFLLHQLQLGLALEAPTPTLLLRPAALLRPLSAL